jgi:hypothetical protein
MHFCTTDSQVHTSDIQRYTFHARLNLPSTPPRYPPTDGSNTPPRVERKLLTILNKIRLKQRETHVTRTKTLEEIFATPIDKLSSNYLRVMEESVNTLNDKTAEEYDNYFVELKELKDTLHHKGDSMLNQLRTELEM